MMVNETNDKFSVSSSAVVDAFVENMDNDDTFSSSEYKQPFVRCFTVSRLEIKYSSENSSCRIKWAAYSHTRGHTPTLPHSAQVYLYSTCRHTAPTGRSQSVCRCMDYLHSAYPHSHLASAKRALQRWDRDINNKTTL